MVRSSEIPVIDDVCVLRGWVCGWVGSLMVKSSEIPVIDDDVCVCVCV